MTSQRSRSDHDGVGLVTPVRPRVTASHPRPGRTTVTTPLSPEAALVARDPNKVTAAAAFVLAEAEAADEVGLLVGTTAGPVPCRIGVSGADTVADLVRAAGEAVRAGTAGAESGQHGLLVAAEGEVGDHDGPSVELVRPADGATGIRAEFDAARHETWWVETFLRSLEVVLSQFGSPDRALAALRIGAEADTQDAIRRGDSALVRTAPETLLDPILRAAAADPVSPALIDGDDSVLYGHLVADVERVAARLVAHGVRPGDFVAVVTAKSRAAITAILGILRAGAAYVPLDDQLPAERLRTILADADCRVVIADDPDLGAALGVFSVDVAELARPGAEASHLPQLPTPDDVAYVIYTSGSTGTPKGVVVRHRAIDSYLAWKRRYHALGPTTRLLQVPSLSFDSSVSDLFSILGSGGTLVLLHARDRLVPDRVRDLIARHRISHITLVPSLYRVLIDAIAEPGCVRLVTVAGEAVPPELVASHWRLSPGARLVNEYGPTENSIGATAFDHTEPRPGFPVGQPIDNTTVRVLDRSGRVLPPGFIGEIHLAGYGLADGYLHQPELTAASFRASDVPDADDQRRYASGDLGWWSPDGLEFSGRRDNQVKVRGLRVELGDVETGLSGLEGVDTAVVVPTTTNDGTTALVGYVVADAELDVIRERALAVLPQRLVPHLVSLPEIPLNTNGKVDRDALVRQAESGTEETHTGDEQDEDVIATTFAQVLGVPTVQPDDDFFALGGHSLLAVELINELQEQGLDIELETFFDSPTVSGIRRGLGAEEPAAESASGPLDLPLPEEMHRFWMLDQLELTDRSASNLVEAFWIDGVPEDELRESLTAVIAAHETLRMRVPLDRDGPRLHIVPQPELPWRAVTAATDLDDSAHRLIQEECNRRFDLASRPPIRAAVLRTGTGRTLFVLTVHHIACDGESATLLLRQFFDHVRARRTGQQPSTEHCPGYTEHVARRADALHESERSRTYWHERLTDHPPFPVLPADGLRGLSPGPGATVRRSLSVADTERVTATARGRKITEFSLVLASLAGLLHRLTGLRTVNIGTPVSLRRHTDLRHTVGLFLNPVTISISVDPEMSLAGLAERTHRSVLEAVTHAEYPFDRLVREIPGSYGGGRSPLFTVMFTMDREGAAGTADDWDAGPATSVGRAQVERSTSEFEMSFHADRSGPELALTVEYDSTMFSQATAESVLCWWATLLTGESGSLGEIALSEPDASGHPDAAALCGPREDQVDRHGSLSVPEIQAVLSDHPAVVEALVRCDVDGRPVAAVRAAPNTSVTPAELRAHVRKRLPERCTPRTVSVVDDLPSDDDPVPHAQPEPTRQSTSDQQGAVINAIRRTFADLLDVDSADPHDDFFDLGGTSLLAMRAATELRLRLGVHVTPGSIFVHRTPAALAATLSMAPPATPEDQPTHRADTGDAPLSADQEDILDAMGWGAPDSAFAVVEVLHADRIDADVMRRALDVVVSRHDALHSTLDTTGRSWIPTEPRYLWSEEDCSEAGDQDAAVQNAVRRHVAEPFDLPSGTAVRARLLHLSEEDVVVLAVHHMCVDGHAMRLLVDELVHAYEALRDHRTPELPEVTTTAADFAHWQRQTLARQDTRERLTRKADFLSGRSGDAGLPLDRPRVSRTALSPENRAAELGTDLGERLRAFSRSRGVSTFAGVLGATAVALAGAGPSVVALATTISLRGRPELRDTIGLLSTTAVLHIDLRDAPCFDEVVSRTSTALLDAHSGELPFRAVAEETERRHHLDRADLARVLVVAEETPEPAWPAAGLRPLDLPDDHGRPIATAYDLAFAVEPDSLRGLATYRGELFDTSTVDGFFTRLRATLTAALDEPRLPCPELSKQPEVTR